MPNRPRGTSDAFKEQEKTNALVRMERSRRFHPNHFCGLPGCMQHGHYMPRLPNNPVNLYYTTAGIDVGFIAIHAEQRQSPLPKQDFMFFLRLGVHHGALLPERLVERLGATSYMTATLNIDPHVGQKTIVVRVILDQAHTVLDMVNRLETHTQQHPAGTPQFAKLAIHPHDLVRTHDPSGIFTTDNDRGDFIRCVQPLIDVLTIENAAWIDAAPRAATSSRWAVAAPAAAPAAPAVKEEERGEGGAPADDPPAPADDPAEERDLVIPTPSSDMDTSSSGSPSPVLAVRRSRSRAPIERSPTPTLESQLVRFDPDEDRPRLDDRPNRSAALKASPYIRHLAEKESVRHRLTPLDNDPPFEPPSDMEEDDTQEEQGCGGGFDNGGSNDEADEDDDDEGGDLDYGDDGDYSSFVPSPSPSPSQGGPAPPAPPAAAAAAPVHLPPPPPMLARRPSPPRVQVKREPDAGSGSETTDSLPDRPKRAKVDSSPLSGRAADGGSAKSPARPQPRAAAAADAAAPPPPPPQSDELRKLQAANEELKAKNAALKTKNAQLEGKNAALETENAQLKSNNAGLQFDLDQEAVRRGRVSLIMKKQHATETTLNVRIRALENYFTSNELPLPTLP